MKTREKIETYIRIGAFFQSIGIDLRPSPLPPHVMVWLVERHAVALLNGGVALNRMSHAEAVLEMTRDAVYYRVHLEEPEDADSVGYFGLLLDPEIAFDLVGTGLYCGELVGLPPAKDPESAVYPVEGEAHFADTWQFLASKRLRDALARRQTSLRFT